METAVIVLSCVCFILGCTLYLVIGRLEWYKEAFFEEAARANEAKVRLREAEETHKEVDR